LYKNILLSIGIVLLLQAHVFGQSSNGSIVSFGYILDSANDLEEIQVLEETLIRILDTVSDLEYPTEDELDQAKRQKRYRIGVLFNPNFVKAYGDVLNLDYFIGGALEKESGELTLVLKIFDAKTKEILFDRSQTQKTIEAVQEKFEDDLRYILTELLGLDVPQPNSTQNMPITAPDGNSPVESVSESTEPDEISTDETPSSADSNRVEQQESTQQANTTQQNKPSPHQQNGKNKVLFGYRFNTGKKFVLDDDTIQVENSSGFDSEGRFAPIHGVGITFERRLFTFLDGKLSLFAGGDFWLGLGNDQLEIYRTSDVEDNPTTAEPIGNAAFGLSWEVLAGGGVGYGLKIGTLPSELGVRLLFGINQTILSIADYEATDTSAQKQGLVGFSGRMGAYFQIGVPIKDRLLLPIRVELMGQVGGNGQVSQVGLNIALNAGLQF
jgi:hypothetical protein